MKLAITQADYLAAAASLTCEVAAIKAVCMVEASKGGFNPDETPVTLFEGHKFHKYTDGMFDVSNPELSFAVWTKKWYGKTWQAEQDRFRRAVSLDRDAAIMSTSFGKFQIMGFNYGLAGFNTLQTFVNAMYDDEPAHLRAFVSFVKKTGLAKHLQAKDWAGFASGYNGKGYAANSYDVKLANAYRVAQA